MIVTIWSVIEVAGGPRGDGPDADRWHCNIQRALYRGTSASYFELSMPNDMLEKYLRQEAFH